MWRVAAINPSSTADSYEMVWPQWGVAIAAIVASQCGGRHAVTQVIIPLPLWIEERAVANRWGVSIYTVQRVRKGGKLKAKLLGGRWKYREEWLREYEDEATPCGGNSESESGFSISDLTAPTGVSVGSMQQLDRRDVHRSAQQIFKSPKSGSPST